jgi:diphthine-ammonia ligase
MTVTALVSGGKDSIYAAYLADTQGRTVDELVVLRPQDPESMLFHTPNLDLVALQAEAWGKRFRSVPVRAPGEDGELAALAEAIGGSSGWVVAGAIESSYQWSRLLRIADHVGRPVYAPLWRKAPERVVREELDAGLDIRFVHLAAESLGPELLGERLTGSLLDGLVRRSHDRAGAHVAGEGGEYETLVVDAPFFRARLELEEVERDVRPTTSRLLVRKAHLAPKLAAPSRPSTTMSPPEPPTAPADLTRLARTATARARHALGDPRTAVNLRWLRAISGAANERIVEVLQELDAITPVEEEVRRRHVAGGRANYAQFSAPFELYALVRLVRPAHVIETGVSSGVSSAHFLLALEKNRSGALHSIDLPTPQKGPLLGKDESHVAIPPGLSSGWAVPFRSPRWDLRIGDAGELLPKLVAELPSVDLFLHDDLHTPERLAFELATIRPKLGSGAPVLADNTQWTGSAFPDFARAVHAKPFRRGTSDLFGLRMPAPRARRAPAAAGTKSP